MKVSELIEGEEGWKSGVPDARDRMRYVRRQRALLDHQRKLTVRQIVNEFPQYGDEDDYGVWRIKGMFTAGAPHRFQGLIRKLQSIDAKSEKLQKQEVATKLNMKYFIHDPELALKHAMAVRKGAFPEGEDAIASTPKTAFEYAVSVLGKRWPKGEPAIASDPDLKQLYIAKFGKIMGNV